MSDENVWLYTVYRNSDDELIAFDVSAEEAAKRMGLKNRNSLYHIVLADNGNNGKWTVLRERRKKVEAEMNEGC